MPEPLPLILNAEVTVDGVIMDCLVNEISIEPDTETTEVKTMCGAAEYPGTTKWSFNATLYQSFDALGTHATLWPLVEAGDPVTVTVLPKRGEIQSATNPLITVECIPTPYAVISGTAGEPSEVEIEWTCIGPPVITDVVTAAAGVEAAA
jgi:hypothetical protein